MGIKLAMAALLLLSQTALAATQKSSLTCVEALRFYDPGTHVTELAKNWRKLVIDRPPLRDFRDRKVKIEASSRAFRQWLYDQNILDRGKLPELMSDKLFTAKVLQSVLQDKFPKFHPPFVGLKEFLLKEAFANSQGEIKQGRKALQAALKRHFPKGFLLKPTRGFNSHAKTFLVNEDMAIDAILRKSPLLFDKKSFAEPDSIDGVILSGEKWMIMGKIGGGFLTSKEGQYAKRNEIRVHTFWSHIVPQATATRYSVPFGIHNAHKAEAFIQKFLNLLPPELTRGQAWGFDVISDGINQPQIVELNNNQGKGINWSGFVSAPEALAGYVDFLEGKLDWKFQGGSGEMLRSGLGNYRPYFKLVLEMIQKLDLNSPLGKVEALEHLEALFNEYIPAARRAGRPKFFAEVLSMGAELEAQIKYIVETGDWSKYRIWAEGWITR